MLVEKTEFLETCNHEILKIPIYPYHCLPEPIESQINHMSYPGNQQQNALQIWMEKLKELGPLEESLQDLDTWWKNNEKSNRIRIRHTFGIFLNVFFGVFFFLFVYIVFLSATWGRFWVFVFFVLVQWYFIYVDIWFPEISFLKFEVKVTGITSTFCSGKLKIFASTFFFLFIQNCWLDYLDFTGGESEIS